LIRQPPCATNHIHHSMRTGIVSKPIIKFINLL
jgi:hypothetical protein